MLLLIIVFIACAWAAPAADKAADKKGELNCFDCHSDNVSQADFTASAHGVLGCTACHEVTQYPHDPKPKKPACATCHADEVKEHAASLHGRSRAAGHVEAAGCADCHGGVHVLKPSSDPGSRVTKANLPQTCGNCHSNPELVKKFNIPIARPIEAYRQSVHGRAVQRGVTAAPACSDCHGTHALFPASDLRSKVNRARVPATCGACHPAVSDAYRRSVHGRAAAKGLSGVPTCVDCHGEHGIRSHTDSNASTYAGNLSADLCARCHNDPRLAQEFGMPTDRAATYFESFHGLASRTGTAKVANCASCHGVHEILSASDPASAVNANNLSKTCGKCHPNAGERFALGKIHVAANKTSTKAAGVVSSLYLLLIIPFTIGGMVIHNLLDLWWKARRRRLGLREDPHADDRDMYPPERAQHLLLAVSFITLVYTGFALKFPESWWAWPIVSLETRFQFRGWIHRIAGVVLISTGIWHAVYIATNRQGFAHWKQLLPARRDLIEVFAVIRQFAGGPQARLSTYNYIHKAEYWALIWGTLVMGLSGTVLWFNTFSLRYLPRWVIDIATTIHYYEAILAALAILVWHGYSVIFDPNHYPMDWLWLYGKTGHKVQSKEEHAVTAVAGD